MTVQSRVGSPASWCINDAYSIMLQTTACWFPAMLIRSRRSSGETCTFAALEVAVLVRVGGKWHLYARPLTLTTHSGPL